MSTKVVEGDHRLLVDLGDHVVELVREFIDLPTEARDRAAEILAEVEHLIATFKRLRPPAALRKTVPMFLVNVSRCAICLRQIDQFNDDYVKTKQAIYHAECIGDPIDSSQ